ncbi:hypothetical protein CROQUDRAFT_662465 [Cronartium quercuum f. sp. fusiforme G11]|uniref:Uncharacterized protein n=1 Tax=Cronartium quercuum f. sp. fusiforme G11 TaxID=708437 RepID=A0A9P6T9F3_9BASI|nr:hypothetical protein CROQUDRAFT_662465 [Cronartium quercuum f. sp. fusiforme G11]
MYSDTLYSVGGPSGEIHSLDRIDRRFQTKLQQVLYCSEADLPKEEKTQKALRYGSHAIEISSRNQAFVPHLGHNSIYMYFVDPATKRLNLLSKTKSPRPNDGPRHCVVSEDGHWLYAVTEHTQFVDLYKTGAATLEHQASTSILPSDTHPILSSDATHYRGDTIRILPTKLKKLLEPSIKEIATTQFIFATTRGADTHTPGILAVLKHDTVTETLQVMSLWPTPTSGGKANAIEFRTELGDDQRILLVLTDDELGWVMVLEWDPKVEKPIKVISKTLIDQNGVGASHAVWL